MGEDANVLEQVFEDDIVLGLLYEAIKSLRNGLRVVMEGDNLSLSLFVDARNHGNNLGFGLFFRHRIENYVIFMAQNANFLQK